MQQAKSLTPIVLKTNLNLWSNGYSGFIIPNLNTWRTVNCSNKVLDNFLSV